MTAKEQVNRDRVQEVFRNVFDESSLVVTEETAAADIPAWDHEIADPT